jgi:hypothetical protein
MAPGNPDALKFLWVSMFVVGIALILILVTMLLPEGNILVIGHPPIMLYPLIILCGFAGLLQIVTVPQALRILIINSKLRTALNISVTALSIAYLLTIAGYVVLA